jgi:hypothetical protein
MDLYVDCSCGQRLSVTPAHAGTEMACACGARVPVPRLSVLRASVGLGAYEAGPIDTIRGMFERGELPWGEICAVSGKPTRDVLEAYIQCERTYLRGAGGRNSMVLTFLEFMISPAIALFMRREADRGVVAGRDTYVPTSLRVANQYHDSLAQCASQRQLKRLLRQVPPYAKLLDRYPNATVFLGPCPQEDRIRPEKLGEST